jgi:hypothetical protein
MIGDKQLPQHIYLHFFKLVPPRTALVLSLGHFTRGDRDLVELKDVFGIVLAAGEANTLPFHKEDN